MNKPSIRFWSKVDKTESCWNWTASLDVGGYGQFWSGVKRVPSHRWSYELFKGKIPKGLCIDHLCRNRKCVNPDHLEAVTNWENTFRGLHPFAANAKKTHCKYSHEFNKKNTYINPRGQRDCRECRKLYQRKLRAMA